MRPEASGLEQRSGDVVREVAEPECGTAQVLEPAVDRLGGAVAGAGTVEVGQHVGCAFLQRAAERGDLDQCVRDTGADRVDQLDHQLAATAPVLVSVGGDHSLVDAPGRLDFDMRVVGEQRGERAACLSVSSPAPVCRVLRAE